jgi:hypothetical protein
MSRETHVLRAVDLRGNVGYYNGKAGKDWLSASPSDAFMYTRTRARDQATRFNRTTGTHRQTFQAVCMENIHVADIESFIAEDGNASDDSALSAGC